MSKALTANALDLSEVLLLVFGLVLTIGILGEYKKLGKLLNASLATFEILVVVGVAGEMIADGCIFIFSRHLQTIGGSEFAALNKEAGTARKDAGEAIERSKILDLSTHRLKTEEQQSRERAERLELSLEAERQKTLRLLARMRPIDSITVGQAESLIKALATFSRGTTVVVIVVAEQNSRVARQPSGWPLLLALDDASVRKRWTFLSFLSDTDLEPGIIVRKKRGSTRGTALIAMWLVKTMNRVGIPADAGVDFDAPGTCCLPYNSSTLSATGLGKDSRGWDERAANSSIWIVVGR